MVKMWTSNEGFDIETARDYASKLVLLGSAQRAGIFEALSEEKDIAALKHALNADERALFIVLEALCASGYVHKRLDRYIISEKARSLFLERGEDYVGGSLPHFLDIMVAWLKLPGIIKGAKPDRSERDVAAFMNAMAEMFAVNMLANTEDGSTYTEAQYREWLTDAGFRKIEIIDLAQKSNQLITAFLG